MHLERQQTASGNKRVTRQQNNGAVSVRVLWGLSIQQEPKEAAKQPILKLLILGWKRKRSVKSFFSALHCMSIYCRRRKKGSCYLSPSVIASSDGWMDGWNDRWMDKKRKATYFKPLHCSPHFTATASRGGDGNDRWMGSDTVYRLYEWLLKWEYAVKDCQEYIRT